LLIEQEFGTFANAIDDFKQYSFDVTKILTEYKRINSLTNELELIQDQADEITATRDKLIKDVSSLNERVNYNRQTIDTFHELQSNGLGLKELKQLSYTIMESALANDLIVEESVKKFFIDLDKQYDNKLGFEKKSKRIEKPDSTYGKPNTNVQAIYGIPGRCSLQLKLPQCKWCKQYRYYQYESASFDF
jgi:uncharacterized protein YoxC